MGRLSRGRRRKGRTRFRPWRADFITAYFAAALGAFALVRGLASQTPTGVVAGIGLATALGWIAVNAWRDARRRWYGQAVEAWAVSQVGRLLDRRGIRWEAGRFIPGVGDVDLLVRGKRDSVTVEVKSFNRWRQGFMRVGPRERAALEQARRQAEAVGAGTSLVWLPRGTPTLLQRVFGAGTRDTRVVFGSPVVLARKLRKV